MHPRPRLHPPAALATLALGAVVGTGCSIPLAKGPDAPTLEQKRIFAKVEPNLLTADDGTSCTVPQAKYRRAAVGQQAWCVWSRAAAEQRGAALPPGVP